MLDVADTMPDASCVAHLIRAVSSLSALEVIWLQSGAAGPRFDLRYLLTALCKLPSMQEVTLGARTLHGSAGAALREHVRSACGNTVLTLQEDGNDHSSCPTDSNDMSDDEDAL